MGSEKGIDQGVYGPWMLSSKKAKKRSTGTIPSKVKKSNDVDKNRIRLEQLGGSRFDVLENDEIMLSVEGVLEGNPLAEGGPHFVSVGGPGASGNNKAMGPKPSNTFMGPSVNQKSKPAVGGKVTQLGPRVRDAKKAARSSGAHKKALKALFGPKDLRDKENVIPSHISVVKGSVNSSEGVAVSESSSHEKELSQGMAILENVRSAQGGLDPGGANPSVGCYGNSGVPCQEEEGVGSVLKVADSSNHGEVL